MTPDPTDEIDIAASYSRKDASAVIPLLDALRQRGVRVWFDKNIPGGAIWEETITRNMRRAKAVIFFASTDSLESDRCFDEVSAARTLRKPIIPVLIDPIRMPDDLPDRLVLTLQTRNTVDAFPGAEGDPVEAILHALASFGVQHTRPDAPRPVAPVAPPPPPPPPEPPRPAPPSTPAATAAAPRKRLPFWTLGASLGVVLAAGIGAAFLLGAFGSGTRDLGITAAEWCSAPAPRLMDRATRTMSLPALMEAAHDGDLDAQTLHCLSANQACTGGGETANLSGAYAACEQAGNRGSWRAVFNQGWLKQRGCGVPVDGQGAVMNYSRASDAGCAIAQFYLGTLYQEGELVGFDEGKAIALLQKAADQNYPPALNRLGAAYALGRGVPEDDARGADLYRRAADLGDARAMLNYARVLEQGIGVEKNSGAAIAYYRRAAQQTDDIEIQQLARDALKRLGADQRE